MDLSRGEEGAVAAEVVFALGAELLAHVGDAVEGLVNVTMVVDKKA